MTKQRKPKKTIQKHQNELKHIRKPSKTYSKHSNIHEITLKNVNEHILKRLKAFKNTQNHSKTNSFGYSTPSTHPQNTQNNSKTNTCRSPRKLASQTSVVGTS